MLNLWRQATDGTAWSALNVDKELAHIEKLAVEPRIPADNLIFRVFRKFPDPANQIKVVLLGQDPYPEMLRIPGPDGEDMTVSRACGLSFSSPLGKLPVSLNTIFREILREFPQLPIKKSEARVAKPAKASDYSGDLSYLVASGVFLLNTLLTLHFDGVRGISNSHKSWICFTTQVLNFIRRVCPNATYLALGNPAADVFKGSGITDAIECNHPAHRATGRKPFMKSDIFIKVNALLVKRGEEPIDWVPMQRSVDTEYYNESPYHEGSEVSVPELAPDVVEDEEESESD